LTFGVALSSESVAVQPRELQVVGAGRGPAERGELVFVLDQAEGAITGLRGVLQGVAELAGDGGRRCRQQIRVVGGRILEDALQRVQRGGLLGLLKIGGDLLDTGRNVIL
jgi:hypothetical protein